MCTYGHVLDALITRADSVVRAALWLPHLSLVRRQLAYVPNMYQYKCMYVIFIYKYTYAGKQNGQICANIRKRHWQRLSMKRKSRHRRKENSKEHWETRTRKNTDSDWEWKRKSLRLLPRVSALRLSFSRSRMWALYVCTCTWNHINIQNKLVSGPWRLPHWSFYRLCRGSVLLRCGEVACK